ncbi:GDSL lipase/esterase, partial [Dillenia turbinata]
MVSPRITSLPLLFLISATCFASMVQSTRTRTMNNTVSAIYVFGDSTVDPGNNNYIKALFKANWYPYGKDFINHTATGRFTNGKLTTDFIASYVGIKEIIPAYLDPKTSLEDMMSGVAFASAASGYDRVTAAMSNVIHVPKQLDYFKEMKAKLVKSIGKKRTQKHLRKAVFIISAGTNDFVLNYFNGPPLRRHSMSVSDYQNLVLDQAKSFYQGLWDEGARRIAVVGLPPMGCVPIVITIRSSKTIGCNEDYNAVAQAYNNKLQSALNTMQNKLARAGAKIVYIDLYNALYDIIRGYTKCGYDVADIGCCGTGAVESSFMCNRASPVCTNASKYVFFDSMHPSEKACHDLFKSFIP